LISPSPLSPPIKGGEIKKESPVMKEDSCQGREPRKSPLPLWERVRVRGKNLNNF